MADSKITALTAISTVDPAADPLVIVDVSDTSMAASGTTKKSTINQLLGAGGTATLASATISGDLTVDTSTLKVDSATNNVSIGGLVNKVTGVSGSGTGLTIQASAGPTLGIWDTTDPSYFTNLTQVDANCYLYNNGAGALLFGVGNVEAMRLNSTGLGVGGSPVSRLSLGADSNPDGANKFTIYRGGTSGQYSVIENIGGTAFRSYGTGGHVFYVTNGTTEAARIDGSGNILVGLTAAGTTAAKTIQIANGTAPTANVTGGQLYVEAGALKYRGSSGTITTLASA